MGSPKGADTFSFSIYNGGVQVFYDTYTGVVEPVVMGGLFNAKLTYNATAGTNYDPDGRRLTKYNVGHGTTGVAYDLTINNPTNAISATSKYSATNLPLPTMTTMASYYGLNTALLRFPGTPRAAQVSRPTTSLCFRKGKRPEPSGLLMAIIWLSDMPVAPCSLDIGGPSRLAAINRPADPDGLGLTCAFSRHRASRPRR